MRSRVRVVRETCETAGDMEGNLAAEPAAAPAGRPFPYSNWGPWPAVAGLLTALGAGIVLSVPGVVLGHKPQGSHLTTFGNLWVQGATELGFLLVCSGDFPMAEGMGDAVELKRTQTIMQGATHCDFRYALKKA